MESAVYKLKRIVRMLRLIASGGVVANIELNPGAEWIDDWFVLEKINDQTFIISEPRYYLKNNSYLILGDSQAILFDVGSGKRNIAPVVRSLTCLPLTVIISHSHSDHLGSIDEFEGCAIADLPINRKHTRDGIFTPSFIIYSNICRRPRIRVQRWLKINELLDLGNRYLRVIHVPGHSADSIALLDQTNGMLFGGDFLYHGNLIATVGGDLFDYLTSVRSLLEWTEGNELIFPAHYATRLPADLLLDVEAALVKIIEGRVEGRRYVFSRKYSVNEQVGLITSKRLIRSAARKLYQAGTEPEEELALDKIQH
ncbi:MAG TPA: MBL fold metallo-hydrolase [Syntrophomonadaceae bacterium]|nr:MBL fold metallo-hydrolase [Syntrophomonadaceae bacterium]